MDVAVTGSTGLIGTALCRELEARRPHGACGWSAARSRAGEAAIALGSRGRDHRRRRARGRGRRRAPGRCGHRRQALDAGAQAGDPREPHEGHGPVGRRPWPGSTRPPAVLVSGSAIGYYGDRGDEVLTEQSAPGDDFLARICMAWEAAAQPAADAGHPRRHDPHRHRAERRGRRPGQAAAAVQGGAGRPVRFRTSVVELDRHRRRGGRHRATCSTTPCADRSTSPAPQPDTNAGLDQGAGPRARAPDARCPCPPSGPSSWWAASWPRPCCSPAPGCCRRCSSRAGSRSATPMPKPRCATCWIAVTPEPSPVSGHP